MCCHNLKQGLKTVIAEAKGRRCVIKAKVHKSKQLNKLQFQSWLQTQGLNPALPQKLSSCRTDLHQPAGQAFTFHHGRRRCQFVPLDQSTGDPGGRRALSGWDDDAHAVVATSSHGATSGIHHKADEEPGGGGG